MIAWLHLSDWHQEGADFDRKVVRDRLIDDIKNRSKIDSSLEKVDFVIFSGDAAYHGLKDEFEAARQYLFDPVLEAVALEPDKLFIIPGNHDIDRGTIAEMLPVELQKPFENEKAVQKWLVDDKHRSLALDPFEAFRDFVSNYTGQGNPDFASIKSLQLDGKTVALLGLNSAWMCARNKDAEGEIDDYGKLVIGEPQIHDALVEISRHDLRIAVVHHGFEWLSEFDSDRVKGALESGVNFILCGHKHDPKVETVSGTNGEYVLIPAGAAYDRRIPDKPRHTNAYNFVRLDLRKKRVALFICGVGAIGTPNG